MFLIIKVSKRNVDGLFPGIAVGPGLWSSCDVLRTCCNDVRSSYVCSQGERNISSGYSDSSTHQYYIYLTNLCP